MSNKNNTVQTGSGLFRFISTFIDLCWLNILWLVCSLPIFTLGLATSAMYAVLIKRIRKQSTTVTKDFFKSFKQEFGQATTIWLINLAAYALGGGLVWWGRSSFEGDAQNVIVVLGLAVLFFVQLIATFVYPLQCRFNNTTGRHIYNAFMLSLSHMGTVLLVWVIWLIPAALSALLVYLNPYLLFIVTGFWVVIGFSGCAALSAKRFSKIFSTQLGDNDETLARAAEAEHAAEKAATAREIEALHAALYTEDEPTDTATEDNDEQ